EAGDQPLGQRIVVVGEGHQARWPSSRCRASSQTLIGQARRRGQGGSARGPPAPGGQGGSCCCERGLTDDHRASSGARPMRTRRFPPPPPLTPACPPAPPPAEAPVSDPSAAVRKLADAHAEGMLRNDPLLATMIGDRRYDDRLPDTLTDSGLGAIRKLNENTRAELARIPRAALSGEDGLTWDVLDDMTRTALEGLAFGDELMPL